MVRLARIWGDLRRRFALLFMIGLALSVASLLEHIQFLLDAWYALVKFAGGIGGLADILKGCAALVSWCVEWWRSLVRPVFQWISYLLPWQIPPWVQDVTSVVFFSLGRGYSELKFRLIELYREQGMDLAWEIGVLIHSIRYALKVALILAALYAIDLAYRSFAI